MSNRTISRFLCLIHSVFESKDYSDMDILVEPSEVQKESADSTRKGLTSNAIPDAKASTEEQATKQGCPREVSSPNGKEATSKSSLPHWHVLRVTYGREKKISDELKDKGINIFWPSKFVNKQINGRIVSVEVSLIQNMFFAYASEEELNKYVFDNYHFESLRYYYRHYHNDEGILVNEPLIVPDRQMESFRIICESTEADTIMTNKVDERFKKGQLVKVTGGPFKGVVGRVARYQGQQRVGIIVRDLFMGATSYVPKALLEDIDDINFDFNC